MEKHFKSDGKTAEGVPRPEKTKRVIAHKNIRNVQQLILQNRCIKL